MKTILAATSITAAAFGYLSVIDSVWNGSGDGLSFATFMLWAALAWITTATTFVQQGGVGVPMIYAGGSTTVMILLIIKGKNTWSVNDTVVAALVVICLLVWMIKGNRWALVTSIAAAVVAAVPFEIVTWKNPATSPIIANTSFLLANICGFIAAEKWTLQDRLYLGVNVVVCGLLVLPFWLP